MIRRFEELGGIQDIFLTHCDDVAEAHQHARQFGSQRIIHRAELPAQPEAEIVLDGHEPLTLSPEYTIIPTPGHARGHCVLRYQQRFLFTGDHLWWSPGQQHLSASQDYCWYSWTEQTKSMATLRDFPFEWVLPGHGQRTKLRPEVMRQEVAALGDSMQARG